MLTEYLYWSATRLAGAIAAGELSAVEVVEAHLTHIEAHNPEINAVIELTAEQALQTAHEADSMVRAGQSLGPLHGVPMTLKDSIDTRGVVTTGGTRGRENHVPETDAPVAARLRQAGAILLGKTNTPELTLSGETENLLHGRTRNPYDLACTPGGSSGGSAAAVAAGLSPLDVGSDTGGSIREPAHYCGIAGIKPTSGRVPRTGHIVPYGMGAVDSLTQLGPMARYVEDLCLALPILCGPDWQDPSVVPMPLGSPNDVDLSKLRVATYGDNGITPLDTDILETVQRAAQALRGDGIEVDEVLPPGLTRAAQALSDLRSADGGTIVRRLLDRWGTSEPGPHMTYCFQGPPPVPGERYCEILEEVDRSRSEMLGFMREFDAIICPTSRHVAPRHGTTLNENFMQWSYCTVYNLTGWPGVVVRAGESAHGLPIGVQIVAGPWREDIALALARRLEELMGGYRRPAPLG